MSSGLEEAHGKLQILARNGPMVASHGSVSLVQKGTGPQGHDGPFAAAVGFLWDSPTMGLVQWNIR